MNVAIDSKHCITGKMYRHTNRDVSFLCVGQNQFLVITTNDPEFPFDNKTIKGHEYMFLFQLD